MRSMRNNICMAVVILFFACGIVHGSTRIMHEDFESGSNWVYTDQPLAMYPDNLAQNWDITASNPHGGSYCAQSRLPCVGGNTLIYSSIFAYSLPTDVSSIFIRFWFRAQSGLNPYRFEFMRFTAVGGSNEIEIGLGAPTGTAVKSHVYSPGFSQTFDTGWGDPTTATGWTEYAAFIDYENQTITFWRNPKAYRSSDSSARVMNIPASAGPYNRVLTPVFYKARDPAGGNVFLFWLDDIEIWVNGVPGKANAPGGPSAPGKPSIQITP